MAGSVTAENPSVMPAVTVAIVATAPTMNCCKKQRAGTASDGGEAQWWTRKEVVAAYFKPRHYPEGTRENNGKFRMR